MTMLQKELKAAGVCPQRVPLRRGRIRHVSKVSTVAHLVSEGPQPPCLPVVSDYQKDIAEYHRKVRHEEELAKDQMLGLLKSLGMRVRGQS